MKKCILLLNDPKKKNAIKSCCSDYGKPWNLTSVLQKKRCCAQFWKSDFFFPHWVGRAFGNKNLITNSFRTRSGETGSELFSVVGLETAAYERPMSLL